MSDKKLLFIRDLFERNRRALLGYLTRRVGPEAAPDLLQETFVRVLRHERLDSVADPPAFLQQIAANLTRDFARRRRTESKHLRFDALLGERPSGDAPADERVDFARRARRLAAAIEALPPRCREVFQMSAFEDLPFDEIARRLGISERMVRQHMSIAMRRCWAALG
ncbi:RNA polymerase sigma factor [Methylosinus sp. Sm6]|uniref:RNA polymerase sigma factor n=1 Tax=Methylosinus sp. Sm6 TaxID=2866948 RepID=UPI001C991FA8|nr:sigma-70 family RNA polymerase sigma factor [Methylosinus sp. Sm6]MBY6240318.1 sigma-70 family RNA polymerase sigma factor [Methylosinus sp. Sm6]